jgi:Xaa-Pro dipeptidase
MDAAGGKLTAWMSEDHIVGFPDDYVQQADRHPMDWIAAWMARNGWSTARIGIEVESYYYSPKAHSRLTAGLPNARFIEADLLVNWIRAKKSPAEIAYMRKAARIVEAEMLKAYEII